MAAWLLAAGGRGKRYTLPHARIMIHQPLGGFQGHAADIDIQARDGMVVAASRSGRVIFSEEKVKGFGKTVIIDHGDGIQTVYSHNSEILVKIGEDVKQAQPIAKVGSTGRGNSPYLHFEIRKRHKPQNPFYYLP